MLSGLLTALSAPSTAGISEGADVTAFTDKFAGRAKLNNRIQKFRRDYMVSDLQEAVDSVGPAKIAQAEAKAIRELKRDVEATICWNSRFCHRKRCWHSQRTSWSW